MKRADKKGQSIMGLPFGIIFSIILIVVFIVIAIIAITHFLDLGKCSGVGQFYDNFQKKINEAWTSQEYDDVFKTNIPSAITRICFANLTAPITAQADYEKIQYYENYGANTFLVPGEEACDMAFRTMEHLNIEEITKTRNPYCIDLSRDIKIKKGFFDKLVTIE